MGAIPFDAIQVYKWLIWPPPDHGDPDSSVPTTIETGRKSRTTEIATQRELSFLHLAGSAFGLNSLSQFRMVSGRDAWADV